MLRTIRKFSSSIFAKIFLVIIAIPFILWGMGPVYQGGKQNTIAEIGDEKISTQEFVDYVRYNAPNPDFETLDKPLIKKLLSNFIGEKVIALEIKNHDIKLSENSLSTIIKNEKVDAVFGSRFIEGSKVIDYPKKKFNEFPPAIHSFPYPDGVIVEFPG